MPVRQLLYLSVMVFACLMSFTLILKVVPHRSAFAGIIVNRNTGFKQESSYWKGRIQAVGAPAAYQELSAATEGLTIVQQHLTAHAFGEALYEFEGFDGLQVCDGQYSDGCAHQVITNAIAEYGLSKSFERIQTFCAAEPTVPDKSRCEHGVGHGLVSYFGYDLKGLTKALALCDTTAGVSNVARGCAGGAFMEYNLRSLAETEATSSSMRDFSEAVKYSPCDQLPKMYEASCIFTQPSWWFLKSIGAKQMGDYCVGLKDMAPSLARTCFRGIGFMVPRFTNDGARIARTCSAVSPDVADRLACWSYARSQISGQVPDSVAGLVCGGLVGNEYSNCTAHDQEFVDFNKSVDPLE